jgi:hypothetical protein
MLMTFIMPSVMFVTPMSLSVVLVGISIIVDVDAKFVRVFHVCVGGPAITVSIADNTGGGRLRRTGEAPRDDECSRSCP